MRVWEALQSEWQVRQLSVKGFEGLNVRVWKGGIVIVDYC